MDRSQFEKRLKIAVKSAGGNKKVSELADIPLGTLNGYLRGVSEPSFIKLAKISEISQTSLDWLAFGEGAQNLPNKSINLRKMFLALDTIETALDSANRIMDTESKAELLIAVYDIYIKNEKNVEPADMKEIIRLVG